MQIFVYESCKCTSPQSVLDNMETRRRSCGCWNFSLHCINMPSVHFCMLGRQSVSHCSCWSGGTLLHTQGAQMTSGNPCKHPELRYQTRGKSANVEWDAPINESQMPGMRIMIGKGIKELGWSIHEMITVSHSLWCHTTLNNYFGFYEVLMHHNTTVMWNGDSEKVALKGKGKGSDTTLLWGFCCFSRKPNTNFILI